MFENIGLNYNLNNYMTNPFLPIGFGNNSFSSPWMGGFNYGGDVASLGLFSGLNYGSYTNFTGTMFLPFKFLNNWGSTGLPIFPSIANMYNSFPYENNVYSMVNSSNNQALKFQFSVPANVTSSFRVSNSNGFSNTSSLSSSVPNTIPSKIPRTKVDGLSSEFLSKTKLIAMRLNCSYDDLLAVMNSESGLNPSAQNPNGGAVGLIQFTSIAIKELNRVYGLNLTQYSIKNMSAIEQLDLVEKYFIMTKNRVYSSDKRLSGADLYALCFLPGRASRETLTQRGENYYNQNRGLDLDGDGKITKSDLTRRVESKRVSLLA